MLAEAMDTIGAEIMGRGMFGGGPGPWDESWTGWWGDDPPFRMPVFVLTHHPHEPLQMEGGTTFTFVTDGIESALEQARAAAGGKDVGIGGGWADAIQQYPGPASSTNSRCTLRRSCWAVARASSTPWAPTSPHWRSPVSSTHPP